MWQKANFCLVPAYLLHRSILKYDLQSGHTVHGLNVKIEILFLVSELAGLI